MAMFKKAGLRTAPLLAVLFVGSGTVLASSKTPPPWELLLVDRVSQMREAAEAVRRERLAVEETEQRMMPVLMEFHALTDAIIDRCELRQSPPGPAGRQSSIFVWQYLSGSRGRVLAKEACVRGSTAFAGLR
jgi:hypothetical protein